LSFYEQNGKTGTVQSCSAGHRLLSAHAWAQQGSPSWVTVLLCLVFVLLELCVLRFCAFLTLFYSALSLGVFMKVVGMDVIFPMNYVSPQEEIHNVSYDQNTMKGSVRPNDLPRFRKTNLSTIPYTELGLDLFMKYVYKGFNFIYHWMESINPSRT
jgi:hypothetical protein